MPAYLLLIDLSQRGLALLVVELLLGLELLGLGFDLAYHIVP